ncbi:uncharacterized protein [Haliotis cracherodii]|uniref:uncharacterized protein n=1 Tax=Haliotis cracherodii TaxID=6455 RepID=UPI0039EAEC85
MATSGPDSTQAKSTYPPKCDICVKRQKHVLATCMCHDCDMAMCVDCEFTHSVTCKSHDVRKLSHIAKEGSSVDFEMMETDVGSVASSMPELEQDADVPRDGDIPRFALLKVFSSEVEDDEVPPDVRSVLVLKSGVILATDWANCSLKAFNQNGTFLGDHYFDKKGNDAGRIMGVCQKDEDTVLVTLPSLRMIATITIKLREGKVTFLPVMHTTKRRYFGIAHLSETKQVLAGTTDTVDILTYSARFITSVAKNTFENPYNMATESPTSALVSDTKQNCLFRIRADQRVKRIHVDDTTVRLRGVTADDDGNVFFCGLKSEGIGWVNIKDEIMGNVLPGGSCLRDAVGISFKKTDCGRQLAVSVSCGDVKVYKVTYGA